MTTLEVVFKFVYIYCPQITYNCTSSLPAMTVVHCYILFRFRVSARQPKLPLQIRELLHWPVRVFVEPTYRLLNSSQALYLRTYICSLYFWNDTERQLIIQVLSSFCLTQLVHCCFVLFSPRKNICSCTSSRRVHRLVEGQK